MEGDERSRFHSKIRGLRFEHESLRFDGLIPPVAIAVSFFVVLVSGVVRMSLPFLLARIPPYGLV